MASAALHILATSIFLFRLSGCYVLDACKGKEVIGRGAEMTPLKDDSAQITSNNGVFSFGFMPVISTGKYQLAIWFAQIPGHEIRVVWTPRRPLVVGENATLVFEASGDLKLTAGGQRTLWHTSTAKSQAEKLVLMDNGNLALCHSTAGVLWESFAHPSNTLLPGQPLTTGTHLVTHNPLGPQQYTFGMVSDLKSSAVARPTLTYFSPWNNNSHTYWSGSVVDLGQGEVFVQLTESGSFVVSRRTEPPEIMAYIFNNSGNSTRGNTKQTKLKNTTEVYRMVKLRERGGLFLYRYDEQQVKWAVEWAAQQNPCSVPGLCGTGICSMSPASMAMLCTCLPGQTQTQDGGLCGLVWNKPELSNCSRSMVRVGETNYFGGNPLIDPTSNLTEAACRDACAADANCTASIFTFKSGRQNLCSTLGELKLGGFRDVESTVFVKAVEDECDGIGKKRQRAGGDRDPRAIIIRVSAIGLCILSVYTSVHCLVRLLCRRIRKRRTRDDKGIIVPGMPRRFSFAHLEKATHGFSDMLGAGGFGGVYKGTLPDGTQVAVKRLDKKKPHGEEEFEAEVVTIGAMNHANLVRLHGFCAEGQNRLLVYEFMENGSLDKWLFLKIESIDRLLDWKTRFAAALSTARAIAYCHEQCRDSTIHCDIKPGNILLDHRFQAKVSDFGLATLVAGGEESDETTKVRGTARYLAPEWLNNLPITVKVDVYSYGMVMLELIRGRKNQCISSLDEQGLNFYPRLAYEEMINWRPEAAADERLQGAVDTEELDRCLKVAFWCIQDEAILRPTMGEVVQMLEGTVPIEIPPPPKLFAGTMGGNSGFSAIVSATQENTKKFCC